MNNSGFNQNSILSPINVPRRSQNGRLAMSSLLSPRRDVSFLSSTRLSPMSTSRYSLSQNNTPRLKNEVHGNSPLIDSTRFNINLRAYTDAKSPGLASRIVQYDEEQRSSRPPTHQAKYDRPGLFPVVHFFKKDIPVIKPKKTKVTIKLAPPEVNLFTPNPSYDDASTSNVLQNTSEPDMGTRSVLDALKEISHKRIHSNEDYGRSPESGKAAKRLNVGNEYNKRMREESPPKSDSSPSSKPAYKKMCVIDPVYASNTSSMLYIKNGKAKATKTPASEDAELLSQSSAKKIKNAETQTIVETPTVVLNKPSEDEVTVTPIKEIIQQRPLFNEKIYEIRKKNKLALMLGAITGEKPTLIPIPSTDELNTDYNDNKKIVSILSPENKEKSKHVKHVSFNMSENKITEIENIVEKDGEGEQNSTGNLPKLDLINSDLNIPEPEKLSPENRSFEDNNFSQSPLSRTSSANFGSMTTSTSIYSAPVSSATLFGSDKVEFSFGKSDCSYKTVAAPTNYGLPKSSTIMSSGKEPETIKDTTKIGGFSFGGDSVTNFSASKDLKPDGGNLLSSSKAVTFGNITNVSTTAPTFGLSNIKPEDSFSNNTNIIKFGSPTSASINSGTSIFTNITNTSVTSIPATSNLGSVNSPSGNSSMPKTSSIFEKESSATSPTFSNTSNNINFGTATTTSAPTFSFGSTATTKTSSSITFGNTSPSPQTFGNNTNVMSFGNSSKASFGNTAVSFGNTTITPTFGSTTTPSFGNPTATPSIGNIPKIPMFGNTTTQSFGMTTTTPSFGTTTTTPSFGVTTTTPTFGSSTTTPSFGTATTTPSFGTATTTPSFGTGITTPLFGVGTTTPTFGVAATTPTFGVATTTPTFGVATTTPTFGVATTTPTFGVTTTTPTFGAATTLSFGAAVTASVPAFGLNSTSTGFGNTATTTTPSFGSCFGNTNTTSSVFSTFGSSTNTTSSFTTFGNATQPKAAGSFPNPTPPFGNATAIPSFGSSTTSATFGNFGATNTTVAAPFASPKPGGFAFPALSAGQVGFGNNSNTTPTAFGASKPFGLVTSTNTFATNTITTASTFGNNTPTKTFGNAMSGTNSFGNNAAQTGTFGNTGTNMFGANNNSFSGNNNGNTFGNTSSTPFGSSAPAFGSNITSSSFGTTTTAPVFSFGTNTPSFSATKTNPTTSSFTFNSTTPSNSTPSTFGNPQSFPFNAPPTTTAAPTFPTFGAPNNNFAAGSNLNNNPAMNFSPPPQQQQQSGVFSFGSNTTPAKPAVFSFGSAETPKPSFNFPGMPALNQNNSFTSPNFNPGGGAFNPQFNNPTPVIFNMGTGTTTRPRTQLRAKRRT